MSVLRALFLSGRSVRRAALAVSLCAGLVSCVGVSSASASSPWWHLTAEPVPSYLQPGVAQAEVQELSLKPGEFTGTGLSGVAIELFVGGKRVGVFFSEPFAEELEALFGAPIELLLGEPVMPLTAAEVQRALEGEEFYGSGGVTVSEGQGGPDQLLVTTRKGVPVAKLETSYVKAIGEPIGAAVVTVVTKARPDGEVVVTALNLGDAAANGSSGGTIVVGDRLPAGWEAVGVTGVKREGQTPSNEQQLECSLTPVGKEIGPSCSFNGILGPYTAITMHVLVNGVSPKNGEQNEASVSGGGARGASTVRPLPVGAQTPFGLADYELVNENDGGTVDTQAGSHPFQQTTTLVANQVVNPQSGTIEPAGLPKDLHFKWPAGLVGNPSAIPQCPMTDFLPAGRCPADTAVGVASTLVMKAVGGKPEPDTITGPLFNLVPSPGEPARFGFYPAVPVYIDPSVRSGSDYGITVNVENISELVGFRSSTVTVWGTPGASAHDPARGLSCLNVLLGSPDESCEGNRVENPPAFLSMPTSCTGPMASVVTGASWAENVPSDQEPELARFPMPALDGCNSLPFSPSVVVTPDSTQASRPTGLNVDVHVPQQESLNPDGLAESDPRSITVTLPAGVAVNPSSGDGLQACSEGLVGYTGMSELNPGFEPGAKTLMFTPRLPGSIPAISAGEEAKLQPGLNFCANAAKIGTATIKTPLLPATQPLKGAVYVATQNENPFGSLLALYLVAEDPVSGTLVKLAGNVHIGDNGQLTTTFENSPQAPFEDAEIHFFGGERAPLATPAQCGAYTTTAVFTPWSQEPGEAPHVAHSTFDINEGPRTQAQPGGTPCPGASLPFAPTLTGGSSNINAGVFTPLTGTFGREDGEQQIGRVRITLPPGLSGMLSNVKLCGEEQANAGTCGPESLIGEDTVAAGVGSDPIVVYGAKIYITGPYHGAPFGLSIVNPVKAGPFDLEHDTSKPATNMPACDCLVDRAKLEVDPLTAAVTITTNSEQEGYAIPHTIDGIPVQIKRINFTTTRKEFQFNPTNCSPMQITGTVESAEGASMPVSVPFQVTNCAVLGFKPSFKVSTSGKTSRRLGASLKVNLAYPPVHGSGKGSMGTQANVKYVKVSLPKQLPSNLEALKHACPAATFNADPASCDPISKVGTVLVHTQILPVPLEGPAIFVSYGGAKFPELVFVLQGYGVTVYVHAETFIDEKTSVTSSTIHNAPDVPFESFELNLPQRPKYAALAAPGGLCDITTTKTVTQRVKVHGRTIARKVRKAVPASLIMPTKFVAQNGAELKQNTQIEVQGCPRARHKAKRARRARHR